MCGPADKERVLRKEKNRRIRGSLLTTRRRRQNQRPLTIRLKLQNLSRHRIARLQKAFLEGKWLWNWLVEDPDRLSPDLNKVKRVEIRVGARVESRSLDVLGSQTKQAIGARFSRALRSLASLRRNGRRTGPLRFKRSFSCLPFKQPGVDFEIRGNRVRLQNLGRFRVLGTHQIPEGAEIANADLLWLPSGFHLAVTAYVPKNGPTPPRKDRKGRIRIRPPKGEPFRKPTAVDLGVHDQITLPNGLKIAWEVPESRRLKRLQRRLARKRKGSKNRERMLHLIRREYGKITNRRHDCISRTLGFLRLYDAVAIQDDCIAGWRRRSGGRIQRSSPGEIRRRMRAILPTPEVDRWEPTTKTCAACGAVQEVESDGRAFRCEKCGSEADRDVNAALNILRIGLGLREGPLDEAVPPDWRELTPPEWEAAVRILGSSPWIRISLAR
jgi:putative transposase